MVIIVTGAIGIGKTTVCEKVMKITKSFGCTCGGILTYKTLDKLIVVDIQTEDREALPHASCQSSSLALDFW